MMHGSTGLDSKEEEPPVSEIDVCSVHFFVFCDDDGDFRGAVVALLQAMRDILSHHTLKNSLHLGIFCQFERFGMTLVVIFQNPYNATMPHLQRNFINFHNAIQINDPNGNQQLKAKRVHLLETLRIRLAKRFAGTDTPIPHFEAFNQGSYSMGTGVIPINGSFDIDIGIVLPVYKKDAQQLTLTKKGIYEELVAASNGQVEVKEPCIRVKYLKNGRPWYHVDLAIYAQSRKNQNLYLARGKLNAQHKEWEFAEPRKLKELISGFHANHEYRNQFTRCIRYLKRWKDQENKFRSSGHSAPTGIAITALAYKDFEPVFTSGQPNDLAALRRWIPKILNRFTPQDTISIKLPVRPHNNLFEKMGSKQQKSFKNKLISLNEALKYAEKESDNGKAANRLKSEFGQDFPVY